jgi:hypothetical protein
MNFLTLLYLSIWSISGPTEGSIIIREGHVIMYGREIDSTWTHDSFMKALGNPEAFDDSAKRIEVYHSKGIVVWKENDHYEEVTEFTLPMRNDGKPFWVETNLLFTGALIIQGYYITAATTPEDLKLYLPQYNWKKNVSDWYEGIYKGVFIYVDYDETAKKINWIDFGVDDENSWSED